MESLIIPNEFTSYNHFCYVVVDKIFSQKNIVDTIDEIDGMSDFSNRIFITMYDGKEYTIRTWNIHDDDDYAYVDYTLYLQDTDFDTVIEL